MQPVGLLGNRDFDTTSFFHYITQSLLTMPVIPPCKLEAKDLPVQFISFDSPISQEYFSFQNLLPLAVPEYSYDPVLKLVESSGWQPWHSLRKDGTSLPVDGPEKTIKRELQEL